MAQTSLRHPTTRTAQRGKPPLAWEGVGRAVAMEGMAECLGAGGMAAGWDALEKMEEEMVRAGRMVARRSPDSESLGLDRR